VEGSLYLKNLQHEDGEEGRGKEKEVD